MILPKPNLRIFPFSSLPFVILVRPRILFVQLAFEVVWR